MITGVSDIAILVVLAAGLSTLAYILRQPVVLAYLATGALVGAFHFLDIGQQYGLNLFSDLGIMFLLFLVGLEVNYSSLRHVGKAPIVIGLGQLVITSSLGFLLTTAFQLPFISAIYVAVAITFSSTVIVVKLLSEKKDLNSLYGKISLGFLLVQDCVAVLILVALSSLGGEGDIVSKVFSTILLGVALFSVVFYLGRKIIPQIFDLFARSQELLFLVTLAWLFGVATLVSKVGFSVEIGGLLAGLSLANTSERLQIAHHIRPLRDFFILIFFIILGSMITVSSYTGLALPIIILSLFILIGNPLIILCIMGLMGFRRRTSFMAGVTVAQISEFSLILMALGLEIGHVREIDVALVTAVGVITITLSNYLILHAEQIFSHLSPYLRIFERNKNTEHQIPRKQFKKPIILIGAHRTGQSIAWHLPKSELLIIDFDPEVVDRLKRQGFDYLFGDIADEELRETIDFSVLKIVISTTPSLEDNLATLKILKQIQKKEKHRFKIIVRAKNEKEVEVLYAAHADYVLLPHFTAGEYLGQAVAKKKRFDFLKKLKEKDLKIMKKEIAT
ncbi:MAG: cation:proton antiporter, partial [Patescibacteria group bacterium]